MSKTETTDSEKCPYCGGTVTLRDGWSDHLCARYVRVPLTVVDENQRTPLSDAAKALSAHFDLRNHGFVGVGSDKIFVYLYKRRRLDDLPKEWLGWPIVWKSGVGRARACA